MDVEITGTPEPTVTWYKDGNQIDNRMKNIYRIKSLGQGHTLTIDKGTYCNNENIIQFLVNI